MLIVSSLNVIVFIAIAVALFWKYRLTRDAGFLWFSAAIVVWPLVSAGVVFGMDRLSSESVPFSLSPNPPKDTDGRREGSGRGWVRELQGRWPGVLG